jgi:TRAP-type C4-dicarboxylate transport system substrate-binding protein
VGPYYTLIGFGTITWHGLTINSNTWKRLPNEVQEIVTQTAKDFEEQVGIVNRARYQKDIDTLRGLIKVNAIDDSVRKDWAQALKDWPQTIASELDSKGMPASQVLKLTLEAAEKHGHKWPYRYQVK